MQNFYEDPEIETIKKLLLDLDIKLNIFDHKKNVQACFWFMLFNFMTPLKCYNLSSRKHSNIHNKVRGLTLQNLYKSTLIPCFILVL